MQRNQFSPDPPDSTLAVIRTAILSIVWACWVVVNCASTLGQEPPAATKWYSVNCQSGSLLALEIPDQTLRWVDLSTPGRMSEKSLPLSEIRQALLGREAVGAQVALVRKWLDDLTGTDYRARETAEKELSKPALGGRFKSLIEAERNHPVLEARFRIQRILSELDKRDEEVGGAFDQIQLTDGTWYRGDLGDFVFEVNYRNQQLKLGRAQITSLTEIGGPLESPLESPLKIPPTQPVAMNVSQRFDETWKNAPHTFIDFQFGPDGQPLATRADVSKTYLPEGLLMRSEKQGYVGISGYAFRADCPPKDNSICVFESVGSAFQRFKGIMEFTFCLPNQPSVKAGVHEFGLFVSRVDRPRDFILEAYNADDQLIATAEASDANCTFQAIRASEPIVRIRLLSNPYLFSLNRNVDEDYCVDDLRFSSPVPLPFLRDNQPGIMLHNGDRLIGSFQIENNLIRIRLSEIQLAMEIPLGEIRSLTFPNSPQPIPKGERVWHAMLQDRTIVAVDPSAQWKTPWLAAGQLDVAELASIWLAPNGVRFPLAGDLEKPVAPNSADEAASAMVFPTCRILPAGLQFSSTGFTWSSAEKKEQDLWLRQTEPQEETAPNKDLKSIDFSETSAEKIPTLWLSPPPAWQPELGLIRLTDGQQFVLGGASGVELTGLDEKSVAIRWKSATQEIPLARILSLDLPVTAQ